MKSDITEDHSQLDRLLEAAKTSEERARVLQDYYPQQSIIVQYREYLYITPAYRALKFNRDLD